MEDRTPVVATPNADGESRPLFARPSARQLIALDGLVAVGCAFLLQALMFDAVQADGGGTTTPPWVVYLLAAGIALPNAGRRLWPAPVFGVVLAMSALAAALGATGYGFPVAAFPLYLVALTQPSRRRRGPTIAISAVSAAFVIVLALAGPVGWWWEPVGAIVLGLAAMGGAWVLGRAVGETRVYAARAAAQVAREAVTEERLRIARELHDVVAHNLSLIAVKAGIANHVAETRPAEARDALRVIETTSRSALTEMRDMLGVLRCDVDIPADSAPPADLSPPPGLAGLPELTERARMAGVEVDVDVRGVDELPGGVELSVYRIVQEALTNVVKHAAPARCWVTVEADAREVRIDVADDGPGSRVLPDQHAHRTGHGLIGMRERVTMYGGSFTAGPCPRGGFGVSARLPYEPTRALSKRKHVP